MAYYNGTMIQGSNPVDVVGVNPEEGIAVYSIIVNAKKQRNGHVCINFTDGVATRVLYEASTDEAINIHLCFNPEITSWLGAKLTVQCSHSNQCFIGVHYDITNSALKFENWNEVVRS